jgi:hypothetical protein
MTTNVAMLTPLTTLTSTASQSLKRDICRIKLNNFINGYPSEKIASARKGLF